MSRRLRIAALLAVVVALTGGLGLVDLYADWLWFGEAGYRGVFVRSLVAKLSIGAAVFALAFVLLWGNLRVAVSRITLRPFVIMTQEGPTALNVAPGTPRLVGLAISALAAFLMAAFASSRWYLWLLYRHATPFGTSDPVLGRDVAYFVFELPLLELVQGLLLAGVGLSLAGTALAYAISGDVGLDPDRGPYAGRGPSRHLLLLAAGLLLVLALGAWLGVPALLTSSSGIVHGASYVDVHARVPALRILAVVAVIGAVLAAYQALRARDFRPLFLAGALYAVAALGGKGYAALIQRFVVAPNEQVRETPFIVHNIAATRAAFGIADVRERALSGDALLTRDDIERNAATLKNVPLWDHQPLLDTFGQIQEIRTYYDFASVDNDRYVIDGEYRQIMLSARELNSASLPNRNWINERLTFTHGYGLTLGPVNQVTPEGLPVLFIKNLPPESTVDLRVTEPSIYFGELSSDHVFVRTKTNEFHYPKGDDNVSAVYEGEGGIPVDSILRKLLFSVKFRSIKTLLSDDLTAESRLLFDRRVSERVAKIAPFLAYDPDPYLAIEDGRLVWVQDAYTTSARYPYSTPARGGLNYIRNSIKATVDAYHGRTRFYVIDTNDPIAATLGKVFPDLLRPMAEMPEGLRSRLRYPQAIFALQASMLATYHMSNPAVFYNKEDQWEIPAIDRAGQAERMEPYYTIMRLPGEDRPEFIQMLPFTPRQKDNLAAWLAARSDGEHYGELMLFQFPKQKVIFGPRQVVARINQDQAISPQITLWNQQGSEVIQGTLLVIPIEESLLYIRPLYLRGAGGRLPELKRVIVAYQNQIVMEETLNAAVERIFQPAAARATSQASAAPPPPVQAADTPGPVGDQLSALAARAREHYALALRAQREGDWARYGEEIRRLGEALEQMRERQP
jgi:uncharacterized membrane protein (UPF0182 family)